MKLLELRGVSVRRNRAEVLAGVSIRAATDQVTVLLGANGVGKSTTLRTISGLHKAFEGEVLIDGTNVTGAKPQKIARMGIAHVPEGRQVFPGLTVLENLQIAASPSGGLDNKALQEVYELFPILSDFAGRKAGVLSGGQQQMLAIGRGLVARPDLMMLDEPSLGLAPKVVSQIADVISSLVQRGIGVLLVEQNATMALDIADHGYLMVGGKIVVSGTAEELRSSNEVRAVYMGGHA